MPFKTRPIHICKQCGEEFTRKQLRSNRVEIFCTRECRYAFQAVDPATAERTRQMAKLADGTDKKPKNSRQCESCSRTYLPNSGKQRWCSLCVPHKKARQFMQRYGLTWEDWNNLFESQGGKCALCDNYATVVDHDHKTGKTRQALCNGCNVGLSRLELDGWAEKALAYVAKFKE